MGIHPQDWRVDKVVSYCCKIPWAGSYFAKSLHYWSLAFILDQSKLPNKQLFLGSISQLQDEDIKSDATMHLQSLGKYVSDMDLVRYFQQDDV